MPPHRLDPADHLKETVYANKRSCTCLRISTNRTGASTEGGTQSPRPAADAVWGTLIHRVGWLPGFAWAPR